MPKQSPKWKARMSEFIGGIVCAEQERAIKCECDVIKQLVVEAYPHTPNSRKNPMAEIRQAIRDRYPAIGGKSPHEAVPFPYFFTDSGKGGIPRWEHLAIKYLAEEWNKREPETKEVVEVEPVESEVKEVSEVAESDLDILILIGLSGEEKEELMQVIGESDVLEWVKQAVMQKVKTQKSLQERKAEDLSEVSSEKLHDKKYRTNSVASRELASRAVRVIKQWNLDHPEYKWCITNKLISELTGVTVKAIATYTESMDIESYNISQGLEPVDNRLLKAALGIKKEEKADKVMSLAKVTGVEGSEANYAP